MRKLIAILLFTCVCLTLLGYHVIFNFQLNIIKSEMKALLKSQHQHKDVVQLSLNESDSKQLYWENENEFRYKGEMYDVVEKKIDGNLIAIRCIPDKKETTLLNEYQKNNKHNSSNTAIVQLFNAQFLLPLGHSINRPEKIIERRFANPSPSLQTIASSVLLPPPDAC